MTINEIPSTQTIQIYDTVLFIYRAEQDPEKRLALKAVLDAYDKLHGITKWKMIAKPDFNF